VFVRVIQESPDSFVATGTTDLTGVANFGFVHRSDKGVQLEASYFLDGTQMRMACHIGAELSSPELVIALTCPSRIPEAADFRFAPSRFPVELPESDDLAVLYVFEREPWNECSISGANWWTFLPATRRRVGDDVWRVNSSDQIAFLANRDGRVRQVILQRLSVPPDLRRFRGRQGPLMATFVVDKRIYEWNVAVEVLLVSPLDLMSPEEEARNLYEFAKTEGTWRRVATMLLKMAKPLGDTGLEEGPVRWPAAGGRPLSASDCPFELLAVTDDGTERGFGKSNLTKVWAELFPYVTQAFLTNARSMGRYIPPEPEFAGEKATFEMKPGENPPISLPFPAGFVEVAKAALAEAKPAAESGEAAVER
jgi:hypothetical protein